MIDLVVLVADKNMEYAVHGLLGRPKDLCVRSVTWDVFVHPRRDPGCVNEAPDFLRPLSREYGHALVMFDHSGCGRDDESPTALSHDLENRLAANGWGGRAAAIVLCPELEIWVWSNSPEVATCLGWGNRQPPLRQWLTGRGLWAAANPKPADPKAALEAALREVHKPRSSSLYRDLAERVPLQGHTEPAFIRLTRILQRWFPAP